MTPQERMDAYERELDYWLDRSTEEGWSQAKWDATIELVWAYWFAAEEVTDFPGEETSTTH